jgi:hypothetical protein
LWFGLLVTGCGKTPPVPEKEKLQQMSFEEFMEHQNYRSYEAIKPDYEAEGSINTKLSNAQGNVYEIMDRRKSGLTNYCNAFEGTIQTKDQLRDSLISQSNQLRLEWLAADKILATKVSGWNDFSSYCVINNKPYFSFQIKGPYIEHTRVDNSWWTAQVKVRKIISLENLSNKEPLLSSTELANIKSDALKMDEENQQRKKINDLMERGNKAQKEKELALLQNRKGSNVMTFFDNSKCYDNTIADGHAIDMRIAVYNSFTKALSFTPAMCNSICLEENEKYTGYKQLQQALNDKWLFVSKLNEKRYQRGNCECSGYEYMLKK